MVVKANEFLKTESQKPRIDTLPINRAISEKEATIKKLFKRIEGKCSESLIQAYEKRIATLQEEVNELKRELNDADSKNHPAPPPLDRKRIATYVADLRALLNQEVPAAAEAIRKLAGKIAIRQEEILGKTRGAKWIATFSPNLLRLLRDVGREKDYPDSLTLEYLSRRIWITPEMAEVAIDHVPKYEEIAGQVKEMITKGPVS